MRTSNVRVTAHMWRRPMDSASERSIPIRPDVKAPFRLVEVKVTLIDAKVLKNFQVVVVGTN